MTRSSSSCEAAFLHGVDRQTGAFVGGTLYGECVRLCPVAEEAKGQSACDRTESEEETIRALVNKADVDTAFCRNWARALRMLREIAPVTSDVGSIVGDETLRRARTSKESVFARAAGTCPELRLWSQLTTSRSSLSEARRD